MFLCLLLVDGFVSVILIKSVSTTTAFVSFFKTATPTLDCTSFRNFRPVSNIAFMSKVIEKVIAFQLHSHMTRHNMFEELQSAYNENDNDNEN